MAKPINPNLNLPSAFAVDGVKTDFTAEKIQDGFSDVNPDILAGDNLNKFIDDTYKGLNYAMAGVDDLYDVTDDLKDLSNLSASGQAILDNKANKDLSNLSSTGEAHFANPDLSNLSPTGQAILENKANISLSNLSTSGDNRLHALKSYSDNGEVLTDAEGLADVVNYAHSTFDLSKFTVVGTPTITDDGIASGFGNNNYLNTNIVIGQKPFKIRAKVNYPNTITGQRIFQIGLGGNYTFTVFPQIYGSNPTQLRMSGTLSDDTTFADGIADVSGDVIVELEFTGSEYTLRAYDIAGTLLGSKTVTSSSYIKNIDTLNVLIGTNATDITIDLKQFSITVDGVPVFSGNKTGIDTIKPNNYTVVGTPTISSDGVASGFSSANYIQTPTITLGSGDWDIIAPFYANSALNSITAGRVLTQGDKIRIMPYNGNLAITVIDTDNGNILNSNFTPLANTFYLIKLSKRGTTYKADYSTDGNTWTNIQTATSSKLTYNYNTATAFKIGNNIAGGNITEDLNLFQVYVNGDLVYQPCLKIPYTQSADKYGSKIVDAVYRARVQDAWEQNYPQRYYTLDEANGNFTLPQGEIYGMMLDKTVPHIIETYHNGTSWCRVWFDGWCEQGGVVFVPGQTGGQVTFIKPFATTDYSILVTNADYTYAHPSAPANSTKSTNGIVIDNYEGELDTYAYWEAKGYIS